MNKICIKCKESKTIDLFAKAKDRPAGIRNECKSCCNKRTIITKRKTYNPFKRYLYVLRKKYGISFEILEKMKAIQKNKCKICFKVFSAQIGNDAAKVDHCHTTNKVRGLLCGYCNLMLGCAKDSTRILHSGISYLMEHQ